MYANTNLLDLSELKQTRLMDEYVKHLGRISYTEDYSVEMRVSQFSLVEGRYKACAEIQLYHKDIKLGKHISTIDGTTSRTEAEKNFGTVRRATNQLLMLLGSECWVDMCNLGEEYLEHNCTSALDRFLHLVGTIEMRGLDFNYSYYMDEARKIHTINTALFAICSAAYRHKTILPNTLRVVLERLCDYNMSWKTDVLDGFVITPWCNYGSMFPFEQRTEGIVCVDDDHPIMQRYLLAERLVGHIRSA